MAEIVKRKSNNPKGRPKRGDTVAELLRSYLSEPAVDKEGIPLFDSEGKPVSRKLALVNRAYSLAMFGEGPTSMAAIKLIIEYTDGKPQQTIVNHNIDVTAMSDDELKRLAEGK